MHVIRNLAQASDLPPTRTVLTIGAYDGIHRGHKKIIAELKQTAADNNVASALITFHPRPKVALRQSDSVGDYLTTIDEKLLIFEGLGLDIVAILPFTQEFAQTPAQEFVQQLVTAFQPMALWVGPDFRFGKGRKGDIDFLREVGPSFDFSVKSVDLQTAGGEAISSTRIRNALLNAEIREVTALLDDYPFLLGEVVHGVQRGRTIGFPTANILVSREKLLPVNGVYAVWIHVDGEPYPAVANIGTRPTFDGVDRTIEVHIFDFSRDIYGQTVRVDFVDYLRPEKKFDGFEALIVQIEQDSRQARQILTSEIR